MWPSIFIGGISGMVSSIISRYFLDKGYKVYGVDSFLTSTIDNLDPKVIFQPIDLCDKHRVNQFFEEYGPFDFAINTAAEASEILSPHIKSFSYYNNLISHANFSNACINAGVSKTIFLSSIGVYGALTPPFTEEMTPKPADPYSLGKRMVELDAELSYNRFGLNYSIIRPYNLFCRFQQYNNLYRNALAIWIRKSLRGEPLTIFGDGLQKRSFSDCSCLCEPLEKLLYDYNSEIFNIGSEKPITILEACQIVQKVGRKFGFNSDITHLPARDEVSMAWCSTQKAKEKLGFKDNTDLEKLIYEMFEFAIEKKVHLLPVKKMQYEVLKGLPDSWK